MALKDFQFAFEIQRNISSETANKPAKENLYANDHNSDILDIRDLNETLQLNGLKLNVTLKI